MREIFGIANYVFCAKLAVIAAANIVLSGTSAPALEPQSTQKGYCQFKMTAPGGKKPGVKVVGGNQADPDKWPGTLRVDSSLQLHGKVQKQNLCTATVVGRRAVITAAHCLFETPCSGTIETVEAKRELKCDVLNSKNNGQTNPIDIALCKVINANKFIRLKGNARIARLYDGTADSLVGSQLLILGYGCTGQFGTGTRGNLFYGDIKVHEFKDDFLFSDSIAAPGTMALCSGDSGGGAYRFQSKETKRLVGINKKADNFSRSWILSTSATAIHSAIKRWAKINRVKICGLGGDLDEDANFCSE